VAASNSSQLRPRTPGELILTNVNSGYRGGVVKYSGDNRFLHLAGGQSFQWLSTPRATLSAQTVPARPRAFLRGGHPGNIPSPSGGPDGALSNPFPGGAANQVEIFSSDGPRPLFYNPNGTPDYARQLFPRRAGG